jgi:hypothetical protein
VIYLGIPNDTLTLNVDPDTGAAQILNGTGFTVAIDTYAITSASGSLRFADGNPADTWNSLQDQGASGGNWFEANSDAGQLSELLVSGGLELGPDAVVNLGSPFNDASGLLDLNFQFSILESAAGDFNGDGLVNAADYVLWRNHDGDADDSVLGGNGDEVAGVGAGDYELWKLNYGNSNSGDGIPQLLTGKVVYSALVSPGGGSLAASTSAVPEPGTLALFVLSALLATFGRRWAC